MLLAIFTLLLLTAMGLSLLCAADLETTIAANYRDKQVSMYAALSGLQEARDRLIPSRCATDVGTACNDSIAVDTRSMGAPALGNPNGVLYILNPSNGESVKPWDPNNRYFDNELCQEHILGLTVADGSCPAISSSVPSGTDWFNYSSINGTTYNDSLASAGEYQPVAGGVLPSALPYKWVRVTVKTDNMTKAAVREGADGSVVCWDGKHQVPIPATSSVYNSRCENVGGIQLSYNGTLCSQQGKVCTFNPPIGSGYNPPGGDVPVTFSGGGGSGAAATAHITSGGGGQVTAINITDGGQNYDVPPTVTITDGGGSGAIAVATISSSGAAVASITNFSQPQNPMGCYQNDASVSIVSKDSVGSGATAKATMSGLTCIAVLTLSVSNTTSNGQGQGQGQGQGNGNPCHEGTHNLSMTGGGGSGFQGTITFDSTGKIVSYAITDPGSGYTSDPTAVTVNNGAGCDLSATVVRGKHVDSLSLVTGGGNYDQPPNVIVSSPTVPAGATPPSADTTIGTLKTGYVSGISLQCDTCSGGSGYTSAPTVTITPAGATGSGATATATISNPAGRQIDSITLTSGGSGYTSNPGVSIGGGGSGASVQAKSASGTSLGRVYMLTAMAQAPGGSKTMTQMEVATPVRLPISIPGALTIDAFSPHISPSSSTQYIINGTDANSCGETALPPKTAVGVIDNPNSPTSPTAVACVTSTLGGAPDPSCPAGGGVKSENYVGSKASPDVDNVYGSLGDLTTPAGCDTLATRISNDANDGGYTYTGNYTCNSETNCQIYNSTYPNDCPTIMVDGNLTIGPGNPHLCGVLLVTGTLTMYGDYVWDGPIFVIGKDGAFVGGGGGTGHINGSLFVAQDKDSNGNLLPTLGTPTLSFNILGGGGNGIYYDHCKSDNMLSALNLRFLPSSRPLKILSVRSIY